MGSDKELWDDFRNGESYALSQIYHQYIQHLFRYGKKFTNDNELIKDTIQDLFFDLIRTKENLGETDNILYYLLTSLRRKLVKNIDNQSLYSEKHMGRDLEAEVVYSVEEELINKETLTHRERMIQKALMEITSKQREILYYRYTCDFDYEEICEIMSIKYDSARKLVFRALATLRQYFSGSDFYGDTS